MASLLTERCYRSTPRGVLTAHAWWLCQCETGACQYHWCSIYRGLERVGSWVPGGSVGRDQLAMAAKVRRHWFNPCRLGSRGHLGANFSLLLYTDLIKKRKPSRYFTDEGELIRLYISPESPFPAPGPLKALFSSKCVYFVSPGYMFMWFHPEFDFKNICSSSVHKQSYISFRRCAGVPPLSTEHLAALESPSAVT